MTSESEMKEGDRETFCFGKELTLMPGNYDVCVTFLQRTMGVPVSQQYSLTDKIPEFLTLLSFEKQFSFQ